MIFVSRMMFLVLLMSTGLMSFGDVMPQRIVIQFTHSLTGQEAISTQRKMKELLGREGDLAAHSDSKRWILIVTPNENAESIEKIIQKISLWDVVLYAELDQLLKPSAPINNR